MRQWLIPLLLLSSLAQLSADGNEQILSFSKAKRLGQRLIAAHPHTFYCNCAIVEKTIDRTECGYEPHNDNVRANRIEWEHVVPAENFGRSFVEWREGHADCVHRDGRPYKGRHCARKANAEFRRIEADLYNLYPAIGELNGDRRNYRYGLVNEKQSAYGKCEFYIEDRVVEPRQAIRGDIARVYFYMNAAYPGRGIIGDKSRKLFEAWDKADPIDETECKRAKLIEEIQGNENSFVSGVCREKGWYE
ncbi:MAG: endonuclease [Spirochaetes bacterium]|nr:endonuclease [Spirochaetota bacterium]